MKKFATTALSLLMLGVVSLAHAVPVVVDAGTYTLTYDSSFLAIAPTVAVSGDAITFSDANAGLFVNGDEEQSLVAYLDSYDGNPFPILLSAKSGYIITGLTETLSGQFKFGVNNGSAHAGAGVMSFWGAGGVLKTNSGFVLLADINAGHVGGSYDAFGSMTFYTPTQNAALSAITLSMSAQTSGDGTGHITADSYRLNVQTTAVPEPELLTLLLAGMGVVGFRVNRNRKV